MEEIEHCELHARRVAATCHVLNTSEMRCVHGWQVKINAILQSKHTQILHLDADNIVAKDPTYLFECQAFKNNDAMFWMDNPVVNDFHGRIVEDQWKRVGLDRTDRINDIETGQMLIDKDRAAKALQVCKHFADHADYWGGFNGGERGVWYGDKTDFHIAFKLTGTPHYIRMYDDRYIKTVNGKVIWAVFDAGGFYRHEDPDGQLLFQHACHRKGHLVNGHAIHNLIGNKLIEEAAAFKGPLEFLDGSVNDAMKCIAPEQCFDLGPDATDREVWLDVLGRNEYLLAPAIPADAVAIDIGANSGAFSYAVLRRGAGSVIAFEPTETAERCRNNCVTFGDRIEVIQRAVWRSDEEPREIELAPSHARGHSGSMSAVFPPRGKRIKATTIALDEILRQHESVHILKLDCEGAEYPILYTSRELHRVEHIIGEYHHGAPQQDTGTEWSIEGLRGYLALIGFEVYRVIDHGRTHGNFWAKRVTQR
jgi:FkbM family methyltransferase